MLRDDSPKVKLRWVKGKFNPRSRDYIRRRNSPPGCLTLTNLYAIHSDELEIFQAMTEVGAGHLYVNI